MCLASRLHENGVILLKMSSRVEVIKVDLNVAWLLDFPHNHLVFTRNGLKKRECPVNGSFPGENALMLPECFALRSLYNQSMLSPSRRASLNARQTLKQMGYSRRRPHRHSCHPRTGNWGYNSDRLSKIRL